MHLVQSWHEAEVLTGRLYDRFRRVSGPVADMAKPALLTQLGHWSGWTGFKILRLLLTYFSRTEYPGGVSWRMGIGCNLINKIGARSSRYSAAR
jgi:hypothetical protein